MPNKSHFLISRKRERELEAIYRLLFPFIKQIEAAQSDNFVLTDKQALQIACSLRADMQNPQSLAQEIDGYLKSNYFSLIYLQTPDGSGAHVKRWHFYLNKTGETHGGPRLLHEIAPDQEGAGPIIQALNERADCLNSEDVQAIQTVYNIQGYLYLSSSKENKLSLLSFLCKGAAEAEAEAANGSRYLQSPDEQKPTHRGVKRAKSYLMPNSPVCQAITHPDTWGEPGCYVPTIKGKSREAEKNTSVYVMLKLPPQEMENVTIKNGIYFSPSDLCIFNAVCTLWDAGNSVFSAADICRQMSDKGANDKISPTQVEAVTNSLIKMACMFFKVDLTQDLNARKLPIPPGFTKCKTAGTNFIHLETVTVDIGGTETTQFHILKPPILWTYSKAINQIIYIRTEFMDIKKIQKNGKISTRSETTNPHRQTIKEYLLRRIYVMQSDSARGTNRQSHRILLSSMYDETSEGEERDRTQQKRDRDWAFICLENWVQMGLIAGYKTNTKGNRIDSIDIMLNPSTADTV